LARPGVQGHGAAPDVVGGDVVRMEISGLGVMETPIVDEVIAAAS
jgi:hypothetical protein